MQKRLFARYICKSRNYHLASQQYRALLHHLQSGTSEAGSFDATNLRTMSLLLRSGTVLIHDDDDNIVPTHADVLIEGDRVFKIEATISPPPSCKVIDCTNKIVSPGFVDTHHHVWQSPLKGLFGDMALLPYLAISEWPKSLNNMPPTDDVSAHAAGLVFKPQDIFWASLAGSLEAIDAGTTTILAHAHINWSQEHS